MHNFAKLGLAGAALAAALTAGCSKSNSTGTGSSSIPLPSSSIPGPISAGGPSTTPAKGGPKAGRPASCDTSDQWSYSVLEASNKPASITPTEKAAIIDRLDKATTALKAALPQYADEIESRTQKVKGLMDGKPSDTAAPGNEFDNWYKTTCITS